MTVSAKTGKGLDRLHAAIMRAYDVWNRRVPTAALNRWLTGMLEAHPPPAPQGKRIKLRYMTPGQDPPAWLCRDVLAPRQNARQLHPVPGKWVAYGFRHAWNADPSDDARAGGQEPLQRPQESAAVEAEKTPEETGHIAPSSLSVSEQVDILGDSAEAVENACFAGLAAETRVACGLRTGH